MDTRMNTNVLFACLCHVERSRDISNILASLGYALDTSEK